MKIAFVMIVFQGDYSLEPCLRSILPFGDVYCAEGPVEFWQQRGFSTSTDRTNEILSQNGIKTVHGQWPEKDEEANAALALVPSDTDFIWCVDSDEIWKSDDIRAVLGILEDNHVDSMAFQPYSFYGGFERYMTGFEMNGAAGDGWHRVMRYGPRFATHRPPTILAPYGRPWRKHNHMGHEETARLDLHFFHYSYVFPSQIKAKTEYYASMGGTIPNYFDTVYKPWVLGTPAERAIIEAQFDGVHDWLPKRRGHCLTREFIGEHPKEILRAMPQLEARFRAEVEAL